MSDCRKSQLSYGCSQEGIGIHVALLVSSSLSEVCKGHALRDADPLFKPYWLIQCTSLAFRWLALYTMLHLRLSWKDVSTVTRFSASPSRRDSLDTRSTQQPDVFRRNLSGDDLELFCGLEEILERRLLDAKRPFRTTKMVSESGGLASRVWS